MPGDSTNSRSLSVVHVFSFNDFHSLCDQLAARDPDLNFIVQQYGYPPIWRRTNTFESLVHIILEQQVSLASALAAMNKLRLKIKRITPANILKLTDKDLKECYFSRQKIIYVRGLAEAIKNRQLILKNLVRLSDDEIRKQLTAIKGIGNWTVDIYLIFVLQRADIFPSGDLAAVNALRRIKNIKKGPDRNFVLSVASKWNPHRTIATMLLWHDYLSQAANRKSKKTGLTDRHPT